MGKLAHANRMSWAKDCVYLDIELEPDTGAEVAALAEKHSLLPFEICATLLREAIAARNDLSE